jgi:alkanesulfonate monooxygenase SsuD/methylene tetrahydromethanopterin reductase-like flavin-dependent oxidoreductase (luciferase family)
MTTERIADHVKFAYWVPNVSGGLVTSEIEQRTDWNYEYNAKLAQTAENNGFEYALSQVRYEASYGAEYQHESTSFSLALLLATQRLKVIAAVHPGLWQPAVLAKLGATADHLSNGRFAVNVVSGWFKDEFTHLGEPWLEHDERYRRSAEFLQVLRAIWTTDSVDFRGDFYRIHDFTLKPKPLNTTERPNPEIFQGGNRGTAQRRSLRRLVLLQRQGFRRGHRTDRRGARPRPRGRSRGPLRAQRLHHRPRLRERGKGDPSRDHRQGQPSRGRRIPLRCTTGRQLDIRQARHVGRFLL